MSLYDDFDTIKNRQTTEKVAGWSSGIKLLQSQLQLKKAATTQPRREQLRKATQVLAPVIDLKAKKDDDIYPNLSAMPSAAKQRKGSNLSTFSALNEYDWEYEEEYNPVWPNEYEKVVKDLRIIRDRENELRQEENDKKRERRRKSRFTDNDETLNSSSPQSVCTSNLSSLSGSGSPSMSGVSGFAGRWNNDDEDEFVPEARQGGAAIAPPPSLQEPADPSPPSGNRGPLAGISYGTSSVAAKIMAKYGFKEGQGLGKKEQGMSIALQVEKTSKRGGRIIHEKEMMPPPPPVRDVNDLLPVDAINAGTANNDGKQEPSITEIMRSPSKVVLLRNMVGPGEVDEDLEPEVKDECNMKYGDVIKVVIFEVRNQPPEEAVRIFVEFKRIESAIKAVVDLNGRYFGGRNVKAGFYNAEKFAALQLLD